MATDGKRPQDAMDELRELVRKSVQANATLAERGAELLKEISKQNLSLPALTGKSDEVLRKAFDQYVRMSSAYTSQLIDLGLDASQQMLDAVRGTAGVPAAPPPQRASAAGAEPLPLFDLAVSGRPGDTCQTVIVLETDQPGGFEASFAASEVTNADGEAVPSFGVDFDPASKLVTGKAQFVVRVVIPKNAPPGAYYTMVTLEGDAQRAFKLVIDVETPSEEELEETPPSAEKAAGAGKKVTARRSSSTPASKKTAPTSKKTSGRGKKS